MRREANKNLLLSSSMYINQKEYWVNKLSGSFNSTGLLTRGMTHGGYTTPNDTTGNHQEKVEIHIPGDLFSRLMKLSKNTDLSLYIIFLAVMDSLIYHYTGHEDIIVISPLYKMNISADTLNHHLFIRQQDVGCLTFKELLIGIRQSVFEAYENQDYPFDDLIHFLYNSGRIEDIDIRPHIECLLTNIHDYGDRDDEEIKNRLIFSFCREDAGISGHILYHPGIYNKFYLEKLSGHFTGILDCVLANVSIEVPGISFMSRQEKQRLIRDFNNTGVQYAGDKLLCQRFEAQVSQGPGGTALVYEDTHLSYCRLNRGANHLACLLQKKGVKGGDIIGIIGERSLEMVVGIWGILKAGAAYLPMDPGYPGNRIGFMLEDSGVKVLAAQRARVEKLRFNNKTIYLEECLRPAAVAQQPPALDVSPGSLAYILYTSGSTGKSKGVVIEQRSVINLIDWFGRTYDLSTNTIVLQLNNYHFDPSVEDIFGTLLYGGTLHVAREDLISRRENFRQYVKSRQVHIINYIPTYLKELMAPEREGERSGKLESLRVIISGGEPLDETLKDRLLNSGYRLYNNYGPTELTTDALSGECSLAGPVTLGKPIANCRAYILGKKVRLLPVGVVGELYISGAGVARGYLNNPELTGEKFSRDPFRKGERSYRTGDLARWLPDGTIEFRGRSDRQVKIRGHRVELGEMENRLLAHKDIKEAVVTCGAEDQYTCAYIVSARELATAELRDFVSRELPDHMIPSYFMRVERIPLDSNGKIDRKALPAPRITAGEDYEAPRDEIEEKLVKIWSEVLGIEINSPGSSRSIGINANFFHLGGHSLKATILAAKIHKAFNVKLQLAQIFKTSTVKDLAGYIRGVTVKDRHASIEPVEEQEYYPLSPAQKRMYVLQQMESDNIAYNIWGIFQLEGALERDKLEEDFAALIQRHESLRTCFQIHQGQPIQRIKGEVGFRVEYHDARERGANEGAGEEDAAADLINSFVRPFDLSQAPLLRVKLRKQPGQKYLLIVDMHHIIADGISGEVLGRDFASLYQGEEPPAMKLQYKDYIQWQNSEKQKERLSRQREYWRREFAGEIPVLNFPGDYVRPEVHSFEGKTVSHLMEEANFEALNQLGRQENATLYMTLLTIFYILLYKITRQEDIIVGTPVGGRGHVDLGRVIGMFVNTLALRNYPNGEKTFAEFLREIKKRTIEAFENQDYPFDDLVEMVVTTRDMKRNPLFDVMFDFNTSTYAGKPPGQITPGLKIKPDSFESRASKVDFNLVTDEIDGRLFLLFEYSTTLFKKETMEKLLKHYEKIAGIVTANKDIKIRDIELLEEDESKAIRWKIQEDIQVLETAKNTDFDI